MCDKNTCIVITIICIAAYIALFFYVDPNLPNFSIEEFSVPAFNKTSTSDEITGDIYFDLKLRNMNKAIGLYYDDPFTIVFSYNPIEKPYQKYAWVCTVQPFYQGNGKTKHIRALIGKQDLQLPSTVVVDQEVDFKSTKHVVRRLLSTAEEVVNFRIDLFVNYRFKLVWDSSTHQLQVGGEVVVNANSGERVSEGSIKLMESDASTGGPVVLMVFFTSFLLIMSI